MFEIHNKICSYIKFRIQTLNFCVHFFLSNLEKNRFSAANLQKWGILAPRKSQNVWEEEFLAFAKIKEILQFHYKEGFVLNHLQFGKKNCFKKCALLFVSLNDDYNTYLKQFFSLNIKIHKINVFPCNFYTNVIWKKENSTCNESTCLRVYVTYTKLPFFLFINFMIWKKKEKCYILSLKFFKFGSSFLNKNGFFIPDILVHPHLWKKFTYYPRFVVHPPVFVAD